MYEFRKYGVSLARNGYRVVPIMPNSKRPAVSQWTSLNWSIDEVARRADSYDGGVGVLCGEVVGVDLDCNDDAVIDEIMALCRDRFSSQLIIRVGSRPLIVLRYPSGDFRKMVSAKFKDKFGETAQLELLGLGQQFVAHGDHPSGNKYSYEGLSLVDVSLAELPIMQYEDALALINVFEMACQELDYTCVSGGFGDMSGSLFSADVGERSTDYLLDNMKPPVDLSKERIVNLLQSLDPADYETWIQQGMSLHHQFKGSQNGFEIWDDWSSGADNYAGLDDLEHRWRGFNSLPVDKRALTLRSTIKQVQQNLEKKPKIEGQKVILDLSDLMQTARIANESIFNARLKRVNNQFYIYNGKCYQLEADDKIRADMWSFLDQCDKTTTAKDGSSKVSPAKPSVATINGVSDALRAVTHAKVENACQWLVEPKVSGEVVILQDGILSLETETLHPHTPELFSTNVLPFEWGADTGCGEWKAFLDSVWPGDEASIRGLQEMFGYLLTADTSLQKMFLLLGAKRAGKGTIARVLTSLLGGHNVMGAPMSVFASNYGLENAINKLALFVPDARMGNKMNKDAIAEKLLAISGEDMLSIERKYIGAWNGTLGARIVMLSNEMPAFKDSAAALANRFVVFYLPISALGKEDLGLGERLSRELPGIFRWSLEGRKRLKAQGRFTQNPHGQWVVNEMEGLSSPMSAFIKDRCSVTGEVDCEDFYQVYRGWCAEQGVRPGSVQWMLKDLKSVLTTADVVRVKEGKFATKTTIKGLSIR